MGFVVDTVYYVLRIFPRIYGICFDAGTMRHQDNGRASTLTVSLCCPLVDIWLSTASVVSTLSLEEYKI